MKRALIAVLAACAVACATPRSAQEAPKTATSADYQALIADPGRPEADRALDAQRKPAEMLAFAQIKPGMKVADLGAGGGYTTELLSRAVGPTGTVYSQNPTPFLRFADKPLSARLARPELKNVVRLDREFDDPFPADVHDLDAVVSHAVYHDTVWIKSDREKMNKKIFDALKPGGVYVVIDSSARAGSGISDSQTLHRIDEQLVADEVQKAGFKLDARGDFLRNPSDTRDWNVSPSSAGERRGTGDRFALRFVKP